MSEFACANWHIMRSGEVKCTECGGRVHYMDGLSSAAMARMERNEGDHYEEIEKCWKEGCEQDCEEEDI